MRKRSTYNTCKTEIKTKKRNKALKTIENNFDNIHTISSIFIMIVVCYPDLGVQYTVYSKLQ